MAKGLIIFKAFTGVGSVAAAGAGTVVAVKSGIFIKKDANKLVQPSESLDTGELGQHNAGARLDNGGGLSSAPAPDVQQPAAPAPSNPTNNVGGEGDETSASNPTSNGGTTDASLSTDGDDGETTAPVDSTTAGQVLNQVDSVGTNTAQPVTGGEAGSGATTGVGPVGGGGTGTLPDSSTGAGVDGNAALQTPPTDETHTSEGQTTPVVPAAQAAPGGAIGGGGEKGDSDVTAPTLDSDGSQSSSLSNPVQESLKDGGGVKTVSPVDSTPISPVVNQTNTVKTHTTQPASGYGVGTGDAAEGGAGAGDTSGMASVGDGGTEAGGLSDSSTVTGGGVNQ